MQLSLLFPPGQEPTDEIQDIAALPDGSGQTWLAACLTTGAAIMVWTEQDGHITGSARIDSPPGYGVYNVAITNRGSDLVFYAQGHKLGVAKPRPNVPMRFVWPGVYTPVGSQPPVVPPTPPPAPPPAPAPVPTFDISTLTNSLNTDHNLRTALGNLLLTTLANGINSDPGVRGALVDVISANVRSTLNVFFSEPNGSLFNSAPLFQRLMDCGWLTAVKFAKPLPNAQRETSFTPFNTDDQPD